MSVKDGNLIENDFRYVYRWEGNKPVAEAKLFAVFMHGRDAERFVLTANWIIFAMTALDSIDTSVQGNYWCSPYGPTITGTEEVTPPSSVNPVLPDDLMVKNNDV